MTVKKASGVALLVLSAGVLVVGACLLAHRLLTKNPFDDPSMQEMADQDEAAELKFTLSTDRREYRPGEAVNLVLNIENWSQQEYQYSYTKIEELQGLRVLGPDGRLVQRTINPQVSKTRDTGFGVRPGQTLKVHNELEGINLPWPHRWNRLLQHHFFPMEAPGTYRLRLVLNKGVTNELTVRVLDDKDFGPEVNGLRGRVGFEKETFAVGEPILATYMEANFSAKEQGLLDRGFWSNHLVFVRDAQGKEVPLTACGQELRDTFGPQGPAKMSVRVVTWNPPPGGTGPSFGHDLTKIFDLSRPGRYTVQYVYEVQGQGHWEGRLPSNEATFEIIAEQDQRANVQVALDHRGEKEKKWASSKPVDVQGLRFVAQIEDPIASPPICADHDPGLKLRVTNVSEQRVTLALYDAIRPRLYRVGRKRMVEFFMDGGRDGTPGGPLPVTLAPGATWTWEPEARLSWAMDGRAMNMHGPDGHGVAGYWHFHPLTEGRYCLTIEYTNNNPKNGEVSLWVGTAKTDVVEFDITAPVHEAAP
jgi:hypothetical protein